MSTADVSTLPERGPGIRAKASVGQWATLEKNAIATVHTEPDACEDCKPYDGDTMRMGEAEDLIPIHPNCRCWYTWDWDPSLRELSMTSLLTRASGPSATMHDTLTKTTSTTDASIVKGTPTGEKDDDTEYLKLPISSTGRDRDGDSFSERGLRDLRDQIRETPRPVFGNHGIGDGGLFAPRYDWKDIIGGQDDAEIEEDADADEKTLYSYVKPNPENEGGDRLRAYVKAGMPVGLSIGFRPLDFESNDDDEKTFHETDLMETSAVGIQSNQESVAGRDAPTVEAVAKGLVDRFPDADLDEDTLAKAIVSEASATAGGGPLLRGADGRPADHQPLRGHDLELRDHDHEPNETHHDPDMDDDTKELLERQTAILENEQQKRNELEDRVDALESDDDGEKDTAGEGDDDPEAGKDADPDGDDLSDDEVEQLRNMLDGEEGDDGVEDSKTTTAAEIDEEKDADGDDTVAAGQEPI
ncbi:hypothetical protein [Halococcus sp. PRR34]|uniref:hypothetical protein n=1 Tax=Halococcus sp. PRR34 TaxID=3020830 RepID=UPI0023620E37|nr:hypothetical protein [Halococcus sp. PRR34]